MMIYQKINSLVLMTKQNQKEEAVWKNYGRH